MRNPYNFDTDPDPGNKMVQLLNSIPVFRTVCHPVLGEEGGACNDERLGGINSNQLHSTSK